MSGLDLEKIRHNKDAILKAEIASLIALWDKLDPQKQNKAQFFLNFSKLEDWKNDLSNKKITFKDRNGNILKTFRIWDNFLAGWRDWRSQDNPDYILQIFYGISESLNSGIDKGSPKENKEFKVQPDDKRWLANAFGSFKDTIIYLKSPGEIDNLINNIKNAILISLSKNNLDFDDLKIVRKNIYQLFSGLLSDDRFPINDVSLWEQAFMSTSMFKALLSNYILTNDNFNNIPDIQNVKWRILGIQYDKFGLAEKGLKLASIRWYRERAKIIDEEIKKLLEVEYPIGNEIYRDETGIYFIVGDSLEKDSPIIMKISEKIYRIFKYGFCDEVFPIVTVKKSSRGLMNLSFLLEEAKSNFLDVKGKLVEIQKQRLEKSYFKKKISEIIELQNLSFDKETEVFIHKQLEKIKRNCKDEDIKETNFAIGICPICQTRLIFKSDKCKNNSPTICEVCDRRIHHSQVSEWIGNISEETIWIDEIKDKNNRIALITFKFELEKWINGDMLNSLVVREEDFNNYINKIKKILHALKNFHNINQLTNVWRTISDDIVSLLDLFDKKGIKKPYEDVLKERILKKISIQPINNLREKEKGLRNLLWRTLKVCLELLEMTQNDWIDFVQNNFYVNLNFDPNNQRIRNQDVFNNNDFIEFFQATFSIGFIVLQIYNLLLERSIGSRWEEFIKNNLSDKTAIDFENRKIEWNKLTHQDIEFLAFLILQFLLRKNPSPARLRRIWETTREFFEEIHKNLDKILKIPEWRKKRLVWEVDYTGDIKETGEELIGDGLSFWAKPDKNKVKVYLISSIEELILKFGDKETKQILKKLFDKEDEKLNEELNKRINKQYISTNWQNVINLYKVEDDSRKESVITLNFSEESLKEIQDYKPYTLITDISPVNYQIIIPAEYLPNLIDTVVEKYNRDFKYVYGKLPLHIGIIISDYKKPLYVSLKALRKIRREVENSDKLWIEKDIKEFCHLQKQKLKTEREEEKINNTEKYYSLYFNNTAEKDYLFYIKPDDKWKYWISIIREDVEQNASTDTCDRLKFPENSKVKIIPNTFDFEFMDTNIRRNDIFYDKEKSYKRALELKSNRPYEIEIYWEKFKKFRELFKEKANPAKMHKLVNLFYDKLQNYDDRYKPLLASAIVNILELRKHPELIRYIQEIFDLDNNADILIKLNEKLTKEKLKLFIDMFEFWHTALKEV